MAADWIAGGSCDAVLAGGVDAVSELVYAGFSSLRALAPDGPPRPFDAARSGLGIGEGAALLLLERQAPGGALQVAGRGLSSDANHLTGPDPTGDGVVRAARAALATAGLTSADLDGISAHGTATVYNDLMEGQAFATLLGERAAEVPVGSIKGAIGHTMAAAGAIEAVLCTLILARQGIPPTTGLEQQDPDIRIKVVGARGLSGRFRTLLSTSSGFGGVNAALIFRA
jgi:3-oxoacyl-[acyl-carrier-protein] synthase II